MSTADPEVFDAAEEKPELNLDVKIDVLSACERQVVVTIPRAEVERYRKDCYDEIVPKAEMPGFRPGKAPRKLVESRFKDQVTEQVKSSLVMDSLQKVSEGGHFSAIGEPSLDFEAVELPDDGDFVYQYKIEVRPEFETPNWQGLSLQRPVCEIGDNHIDRHLSRTLSRFVQGEPTDEACQAGDTVVLHGSFVWEGKLISQFEEEKAVVRKNLAFGDAVIEGFDKLIAGKKEGESFSTQVTISDSASNENLRGKVVTANLEIVEIQRIDVNGLSDVTLSSLGFDSTEELRGFIRDELNQQYKYHQLQSLRKQVVKILTAGADWEIPESLIRSQTNRELQRMVLELQRSGFTRDQINRYVNLSRLDARQSTINALREHFVLEKIAEDLKIEPPAEEYDREIALIAEQNNSSARRVRARLEKTGQMDALRNQIVERMVIEKIVDAAVVKDVTDEGFLASSEDSSDIDFSIAGDFDEIPEAKHDNAPAEVPGAPKLPGMDSSDKS
jgi:trigger factor